MNIRGLDFRFILIFVFIRFLEISSSLKCLYVLEFCEFVILIAITDFHVTHDRKPR